MGSTDRRNWSCLKSTDSIVIITPGRPSAKLQDLLYNGTLNAQTMCFYYYFFVIKIDASEGSVPFQKPLWWKFQGGIRYCLIESFSF